MASILLRQSAVVTRSTTSQSLRGLSTSSVIRKDLVKELYLRELKAYKPRPADKDAHVGAVKDFSLPQHLNRRPFLLTWHRNWPATTPQSPARLLPRNLRLRGNRVKELRSIWHFWNKISQRRRRIIRREWIVYLEMKGIRCATPTPRWLSFHGMTMNPSGDQLGKYTLQHVIHTPPVLNHMHVVENL